MADRRAERRRLLPCNHQFGHITFDNWMKKYNAGGSYYDWSLNNGHKEVRAWCKLSDIEPYKQKDDGIIPF